MEGTASLQLTRRVEVGSLVPAVRAVVNVGRPTGPQCPTDSREVDPARTVSGIP